MTRRLFLVFSLVFAATRMHAQCPVIAQFGINHTTTSYTLTWSAATNVANPTYEILQASGQQQYCPLPTANDFTVIGTTQARTFTVNKTTPGIAYFVTVRVQGQACSSPGYYGADTFSTPPAKPVIQSATVANNIASISFNYSDPKAVSVWLYRVNDQKYISSIASCGAAQKTITDPQSLPNGAKYQIIAFNTGNVTGLNGVRSDEVSVGAVQAPSVSFSASPTAIRAGQSATLAWRTSDAHSVIIDQGVGQVDASGAVTVTPGVTTTYTLTASGGGVNTTSSVTVVVNTSPSVAVSTFPSALVQTAGSGGATTTYTLTNAGGSVTSVFLQSTGGFFTQSPSQFSLAPGASQVVTITATAQAAGTYSGASIPSGSGVPAGLQIPVKLLSAVASVQPVAASPASNRVDVAEQAGSTPSGSVTFRNDGEGTLTGLLTADVPWIVPQAGLVSIAPHSSGTFTFTIDRTKRPDAETLSGSLAGNISLVYVSGGTANAKPFDGAPSVSTVTVVDTVKLAATNGAPPPIGAGEVALFIPGAGHVLGSVGLFISDISILNPSGNRRIDDMKLYYTPLQGTVGPVQKTATVPPVAASTGVALADVVKNVFGNDSQVGSLQVRSASADKLSVSTNVFNSSNPAGTYGTAIPTMRSDRSVLAGSRMILTGLRSDAITHTNLYYQETGGGNVTINTQFIAADGTSRGSRSDSLTAFGVLFASAAVPADAVSAIMTSDSGSTGRFLAIATPVDKRSGDTWAVGDWSRQYGYNSTDPVVVPVAGTLRGANNTFFRTDLAIMNTGDATTTGTLRFISPTAGTIDRTVTLAAQETSVLPDVIGTLFNLTSASGYLVFTPAGGTFAVTSRTYATVGESPATFGTHVPALPSAAALKLGALRSIDSLEDSSSATVVSKRPGTFRTNIGLVETSGNAVSVRVTIKFSYPAGSKTEAVGTASKVYDLAPNQFLQINGFTADILGSGRASIGDLRGIQADFQVISGSGAVTIFTSSTDNGSADSILRTE
jgi:plastocyanin